jgi:hypothetical protein
LARHYAIKSPVPWSRGACRALAPPRAGNYPHNAVMKGRAFVSRPPFLPFYSPNVLEGEFSELRLNRVLRSTLHLAPAKQPPDIRVVSPINYNARMRSNRAGQLTEESSAAESGILPNLTNPLSGVTRKERLYLLGTSAIAITTIMFTGLILLRRASSQRKGESSSKRSKTRGGSMFGWGKKKKPNK